MCYLDRDAQDAVDGLIAGTGRTAYINIRLSEREAGLEALRRALGNRGDVTRGWHVKEGQQNGKRIRLVVLARNTGSRS